MQQDHPILIPAYQFRRILPAPGSPVGVQLCIDKVRVRILHDQVIDQLVPKPLEFLKMVVVIIPHALSLHSSPMWLNISTAALQIVQISIGIKFDVAADLCVSQLCVIVQYSRQSSSRSGFTWQPTIFRPDSSRVCLISRAGRPKPTLGQSRHCGFAASTYR